MEQMDREEQMEQEEPRGAIYIEPSVDAKEEEHTEPSEGCQSKRSHIGGVPEHQRSYRSISKQEEPSLCVLFILVKNPYVQSH